MDHVVVDVEIQRAVAAPLTWQDTDKMLVAVAVVYEFSTDRFRIYGPDDLDKLRARLEAADRISGYNIWEFDFPVIYGVPKRQPVEALREKTDDLLTRIFKAIGHREKGYSLDNVARATLGVGKIEAGIEAPRMFQTGQYARLANYCVDDVTIERDLTQFVDKCGFVVNGNYVTRIPPWTPPKPKSKFTSSDY